MFNKQVIGYVEKEDILLAVRAVDLITQEVTLQDVEGEAVTFPMSEVELLPEIGVFEGVTIFNRDVFQREDGRFLEIVLQEDGNVAIYLLSKELEREQSGTPANPEQYLKRIEGFVKLVANIHEIEAIEEYDFNFNVKVVKDFNGKFYTYYYACNNKDKEEIDLIKVVFVGHQLIEEEAYERTTVSHEDFVELLHTKQLIDVSQQELANYAYGVLQGVKATSYEVSNYDNDEDDSDECVEPFCDVCERTEDDCECTPW